MDGSRTIRDRLQSMLARAERKNHAPRIAELSAKLEVPPFPEPLHHVWRAYWRLRGRKGTGEAGPSPIEWPDIEAFMRATRFPLLPWEVELIEALDNAYLASCAEAMRQQQTPDTAPAHDPEAFADVLGRGRERRSINARGGKP